MPGSTPPQAPSRAIVDSEIVRLPVTEADELHFVHLSSAQGLSQTRVTNIVQDNKGFLWFGTQYGLNQYDGYRFRLFKHERADPDSLSCNWIFSLFKDRSGALWVGCLSQIDRLDPVTERITHFDLNQNRGEDSRASVRAISEDDDGLLWLSTATGLLRLDPASGRVERFQHDPADPASLSDNDIKSARTDSNGTLWVSNGTGLDAFDRKTNRVTFHIPLVESRDLSFFEDSRGVFWVLCASGNGLAILDRKTGHLTRYAFRPSDPPGAPLTGVIAMLEDRDHNLWLGTFTDGLLRFDRNKRQFIRYRHRLDNPDSLSEDRITTLFEDREGNVWVGLGTTPPNFFSEAHPRFVTLPFDRRDPANLGETLVNCIMEDSQGLLWFGTTGALERLDRKTGALTAFHVPGGGVNADVISIAQDPSGFLWLATTGEGLFRFDPRTGKYRVFHHDPANPTSLSSDVILRVLVDHSGIVWARTLGGVDRIDPEPGTITPYLRQSEGSVFTGSIVEDADHNLWINNNLGLLRFDPVSGQSRQYHTPPRPDGSRDLFHSIHIDKQGFVWAGTQDGLLRLDPRSGETAIYGEAEGLPARTALCILGDERGNLWMSTTQGIVEFNPVARTTNSYSAADGLPGNDLTGWGACARSASGEMFFGGFPGATAFRPEDIHERDFVPPVVLTDLEVDGVPIRPGAGSLLPRSISHTESLRLSHAQNNIVLGFAALSYRSPSTNRYRFKLEGFDSDWRRAGSDRRVAAYTALPAGHFVLRLQGATGRGPWSEPGTALTLDVLPPWYAMWWFRALAAATVLLLVWAGFLLRMGQLARQFEIRLEERIGERTRIARELHDSLLQGFQGLMFRLQAVLNLLPAQADKAIESLRVALEKGDQAIAEARAAVEDLRSTTLIGDELTQSLTRLMDELVSIVESTARPSCRVRVEGKSRPLVSTVRDEIQRIAREALRNAFSHSHGRTIEAEISYGETTFALRVRDDGVGINTRVLEMGRRSGHWGLPGMRERAELLGGRFELWSEAGAGTEVQISLPAAIAYAL